MRTKKNKILIMLLLAALMSACTYETIAPPEEAEIPDVVSFNDNIIPIFNDKCNNSGCHNAGGQRPDLSPANAYNSLVYGGNYIDTEFPEESELYKKITVGSMKNYATPNNAAFILEWIKQGALEK